MSNVEARLAAVEERVENLELVVAEEVQDERPVADAGEMQWSKPTEDEYVTLPSGATWFIGGGHNPSGQEYNNRRQAAKAKFPAHVWGALSEAEKNFVTTFGELPNENQLNEFNRMHNERLAELHDYFRKDIEKAKARDRRVYRPGRMGRARDDG